MGEVTIGLFALLQHAEFYFLAIDSTCHGHCSHSLSELLQPTGILRHIRYLQADCTLYARMRLDQQTWLYNGLG